MSFLNINLNDLPEDENSYELIPEGWYSASIDAAEVATTKAGNGQYIKLKLKIFGPTNAGRFVFANVNIQNPNADAQRIGLGQLRSIMAAIGLNQVQDSDQLIGGQLMIKVGVKEGSNGYEAQNTVKGYKSISSNSTPRPVVQQKAPQQAYQAAQQSFEDDVPF